MAKKKIEVEEYSYGIYQKWDRSTKELPKLKKITGQIPLMLDIEFGYVLHIRGAKGKRLRFCIDHPPFKDDEGKLMAPFTGEYFINSNFYEFFLGDTIWEPMNDKKGNWKLTTWIDGKIVAQRTLIVSEQYQ